jgi:hypothetical protein
MAGFQAQSKKGLQQHAKSFADPGNFQSHLLFRITDAVSIVDLRCFARYDPTLLDAERQAERLN